MASVMSAWGMLATKLRFEATRSHVGETDQVDVDELRAIYAQMERDGRARMSEWFDGPIEIQRSADMRYGEQIHEIDVPLDGIDLDADNLPAALKAAFERRHETLYTYSMPDQQPVLVNARLATVGNLPLPADEPLQATTATAAQIGEREIYLQGWRRVPAFSFSALAPGQTIDGAAIVESPTTTVLLRDGDVATVTSQGWLDIAIGDRSETSST
jgi:N-methylhydantoinase A